MDMLSQILYDKTVDVGKTYAVLIKDNFPLFTSILDLVENFHDNKLFGRRNLQDSQVYEG